MIIALFMVARAPALKFRRIRVAARAVKAAEPPSA